MSSSDSLTTSSTGTPSSSSIHSISLLELDIHFLKLNPASFLFFILDLAFFVQLKCFRNAVFPLIEVIYIERGQKITYKLGIISFIPGHVVSDCFVWQKGRTRDAKYNSVETFHDNAGFSLSVSSIQRKRKTPRSASWMCCQSNSVVPETHQYIWYVRKQ